MSLFPHPLHRLSVRFQNDFALDLNIFSHSFLQMQFVELKTLRYYLCKMFHLLTAPHIPPDRDREKPQATQIERDPRSVRGRRTPITRPEFRKTVTASEV